jgi:hypothetical protein
MRAARMVCARSLLASCSRWNAAFLLSQMRCPHRTERGGEAAEKPTLPDRMIERANEPEATVTSYRLSEHAARPDDGAAAVGVIPFMVSSRSGHISRAEQAALAPQADDRVAGHEADDLRLAVHRRRGAVPWPEAADLGCPEMLRRARDLVKVVAARVVAGADEAMPVLRILRSGATHIWTQALEARLRHPKLLRDGDLSPAGHGAWRILSGVSAPEAPFCLATVSVAKCSLRDPDRKFCALVSARSAFGFAAAELGWLGLSVCHRGLVFVGRSWCGRARQPWPVARQLTAVKSGALSLSPGHTERPAAVVAVQAGCGAGDNSCVGCV